MSVAAPPLGAREKEVLRDVKRVIKDANVAIATGATTADDQRVVIHDKAASLLAEYESSLPTTTGDLLAVTGLHLVTKERALSEAILASVIARGVRPTPPTLGPAAAEANEYAYGVAGLQLVTLYGDDKLPNAADKALHRAWTQVRTACTHLNRRAEDRHARLFDVYLLLNARTAFLAGDTEETLRSLSQMTAHKLVLDEHTYSVVALLKALAQIKTGQLPEARTTLYRRSQQEHALHEIDTVTSSLAGTTIGAASPAGPVAGNGGAGGKSPASGARKPATAGASAIHGGLLAAASHVGAGGAGGALSPSLSKASPATRSRPAPGVSPAVNRKKGEGVFGTPSSVFHLCHDLHMYLCAKLDNMEEAKDVFIETKGDYPRGAKMEAFLKHLTDEVDLVGECHQFLGEWTLDAEHIRAFTVDVHVPV
ncbi:hypothetical protein GGF31_004353 [Allomyces arbusculus]|nr:hypothetical protein GGF31_004353 [Allomyces arbusculus]